MRVLPLHVLAISLVVCSASIKIPEGFSAVGGITRTQQTETSYNIIDWKSVRRMYTSAAGSGVTGGSGVTAGSGSGVTAPTAAPTAAAPTPAPPTPPPTPAGTGVQISQAVTFSSIANVAAYTADVAKLCDNSYGKVLGIYDHTAMTWSAGCSVSSTAVAARRAVVVTFVAAVSASKASAASSQSDALAAGGGAATLTTAMAAVKAADSSLAAVVVPTPSAIAASTKVVVISGASSTISISVFALIAGVLALYQC